ncbi:hypothetical protein ASPNIDRAFT_42490 [Aspergillus niger ATCC 1015]|uniref:Uncharacterized protein n=1 Tax=Aspergillus niger (strain ATCC 1015 / CBS 113.46 / FGSC A1144 / LSHB Ac4 / NCTC 3858a / NRRL 328 / USDA 3528.7) TaxID=380704 RepID=G3XV97_ASPNA|nr:hypothetical protein ASPNIDRAFT_42490 [Aspergillus niger ATCC 1015]
MGRAWDTDYTAPDTLPNSTGLGWVVGTGLGHRHPTRTVDQTPTRDWPRLGGWDGPGTTTRHTQHSWVGWDGPGITTRHTQHRLITGLASWLGGWDGPGRPYIIYTHLRPNSTVSCLRVGFQFGFWFIDLYRLTNVPGPTVGWMGQAWDIEYNTQHMSTPEFTSYLADSSQVRQHFWPHGWVDGTGLGLIRVWPHGWVDGTGLEDHILYILLSSTTQRDNIPGPMVGWLGWAWDNSTQLDNTTQTHTRVWPHGWADGTGLEDHIIYTCSDLTQGHTASATSQALVGWQGRAWDVVVDFDNTALASLSIPACMTIGRAWAIGFNIRQIAHCSGGPGIGWAVGTDLGHRTRGGWGLWSYKVTSRLKRLTASIFALSKPWLGGFTAVVSQASVGWLGRAWDIGHGGGVLKPWFTAVVNQALVGGRDGPGTSDTEGGGGLRIMEVTLLDSQSRDMTALSTYSRPWLGGWDGLGVLTNFDSTALVGWMGWAWDILTNLNSTVSLLAHYIGSYLWLTIYRFTTAVDQASAGWLGRAWDTLTNLNSIASVGRLGRAWDMDSTPAVQAHHRSELGPGWVAGTGLGHRTRGVGVLDGF